MVFPATHPEGNPPSNFPKTEAGSDSFISGEFEHDKTEATLAQVKASKSISVGVKRTLIEQVKGKGSSLVIPKTAVVSCWFTVSQMLVILIPHVAGITEPMATHISHVCKPRYTVTDLPFSPGGEDLQIWHKAYVSALLAWAGSQDNPFGTNGQMNLKIMAIWQHVYPAIPLTKELYEALQHVV